MALPATRSLGQTGVSMSLEELLRGHSAEVVESAADVRRQRVYVVPRSPAGAAELGRRAAEFEPWQLRLVKCVPVTPEGAPDFELLAGYPFVDAELVDACRAALPGDSEAVALARDYWEPGTLLLGRDAWGAEATPATAAAETPKIPAEQLAKLPLAYAKGPDLAWSGPKHATLVDALKSHAAESSGDAAGITYLESGRETFESYGELLSTARRVLFGLQRLGLAKGDPLPLQINDRRQHFHVLWGCLLGGIIPVTIAVPPRYEADAPVFQKLRGVWRLLGGRHVLAATSNVAPLEKLLPEATVCNAAELDLSAEGQQAELEPGDVAFYQLTSGSTGTPKCIPETHAAIIAHIQHSAVDVGYAPGDRTLNWLPLDHVVPMLTFHMKDAYLGCRAFQVPTAEVLAEPLLWLDLMEKHRVNYSWSPNFGFKLVAAAARKKQAAAGGAPPRWDLACLKRLMNAGEQVTPAVCDDFLRAAGLPPEVMQPAFGMAEVATCMTYANDYGSPSSVHRVLKSTLQGVLQVADKAAAAGEVLPLVDLGPPSPGVEIRIARGGTDEVLKENQVGHLQIRGSCVMQGYYNNPEANAESFVGDGWFDSGDLGYLTGGRLVLTGRAKEMIIVRGANFYAYEIEDNIAELEGCTPALVAATSLHSEASGTEGLLVFFVPDPAVVPERALENLAHGFLDPQLEQVLKRIHGRVAGSFGVNPEYVIPLPRAGFHKTTSGKIQRGAFKKAFLEGAYREVAQTLRRALSLDGRCVPDWFTKPVWQRREAAAGIEDCGPVTETNTFVIQPGSRELARALGASAVENNPPSSAELREPVEGNADGPARIVYAFGEDCAGLIALGQSLGEVRGDAELYVVTRGSLQVVAGDAPTPDQLTQAACSSGIVKALAAELPCIRKAVCIDVDDALAADADVLADRLRGEFAGRSADQQIALRGDARYVRRYQRCGEALATEIAASQSDGAGCFRPGGAYVVSGGLGAIGVEVVQRILDVEGTSVLILGRRQDVRGRLAELAWQTGGDARVDYAALELGSDERALERRVREFLDRCNKRLAGVVHLAGHFERRTVAQLTADAFEQAVRAKVRGSVHLHRVLKALAGGDRAPTFLHFGSVASFFAGGGLAAYSAGCTFQQEFCALQRSDGVDSRALVWSIWEDTGLGARDRALGFPPWVCPIARSQALSIFDALVRDTTDEVIAIGANLRHPDLARLSADADDVDYRALCVFHTPEARLDVAHIERAVPRPHFVAIPQMPHNDRGIDTGLLGTAGISALAASERHGPCGATEECLAAVWKEVLGVAHLGRDDNFFELGGDSLSWMDAAIRAGNALSCNIDALQTMQYASIAELARHLDGRRRASDDPESGGAPGVEASGPSVNLLVTLKKGADPSLAPVFLFPTIAGTTGCFQELLSHVDARRPVVGIVDPYLQGDHLSRLLTFDAWMARYADAIQSLQPHGPYTLVSYSQGSTWLWGTADQLFRRNEAVDRCFLLDPFFPGWDGCRQGFDWLATWLGTKYRRVPRFLRRLVVARLFSHMMGIGLPMRTERQRELSLAKTYQRFTSYRENLWLYTIFMELDTGIRVLDRFRQLNSYDRQQFEDDVDFLCRKTAEKLQGTVPSQYLKDVMHVMAYGFLRASTYRPVPLPETTEVIVVAPQRNGLSLARESGLDRLVAPGKLREIDVELEALDKSRHATARLRKLYRPLELHYRCMHDPQFIRECIALFQTVEIAE